MLYEFFGFFINDGFYLLNGQAKFFSQRLVQDSIKQTPFQYPPVSFCVLSDNPFINHPFPLTSWQVIVFCFHTLSKLSARLASASVFSYSLFNRCSDSLLRHNNPRQQKYLFRYQHLVLHLALLCTLQKSSHK